jgi:cell division protein FtsB
MNVNVGIWSRLTRIVAVLLFVAFGAYASHWYVPLFQQNERMRKRNLDLEAKIAVEDREARRLKASIDAVQNDGRTLERLAREKLGYAKSNETIIHFEPGTTASAPRR